MRFSEENKLIFNVPRKCLVRVNQTSGAPREVWDDLYSKYLSFCSTCWAMGADLERVWKRTAPKRIKSYYFWFVLINETGFYTFIRLSRVRIFTLFAALLLCNYKIQWLNGHLCVINFLISRWISSISYTEDNTYTEHRHSAVDT
jgi:hypothetical protein